MDQNEQKSAQSQEPNVVFKTAAVGGFEKRAVLDYIYKMNETAENERSEFLSRIAEFEETKQSIEESNQHTNNKMRTLERDLASVSNELSKEKHKRLELENLHSDLKVSIEKYKTQIAELSAKKLTPPPVEVAPLSPSDADRLKELELLATKQDEIEKASYQLGRVMIDARTDADSLVENASETAKNIVDTAHQEAEALLQKAEEEAKSIVKNAEDSAKETVDSAKSQEHHIKAEADSYSAAKISTANTEVERVMSEANTNIANMISSSKEASDVSEEELSHLTEETTQIRKYLESSFTALLDRTAKLGDLISGAKDRITSEQSKLAQAKLLDLSGLSLPELEALTKTDEPSEISEEVKTPATDFIELEMPNLSDDSKDEAVEDTEIFTAEAITATPLAPSHDGKEGITATQDTIIIETVVETITATFEPLRDNVVKLHPETASSDETVPESEQLPLKSDNDSFKKPPSSFAGNRVIYPDTELKSTIEGGSAFGGQSENDTTLAETLVEADTKPDDEEDGLFAPKEENDNPSQPLGSQSRLLEPTSGGRVLPESENEDIISDLLSGH